MRVNFNYFISEEVFDFILDAVELVASDGWRLLPQYRFTAETGLWRHAAGLAEPPLSLTDISYDSGQMVYAARRHHEPAARLAGYLKEAEEMLSGPPPTDWPAVDPILDADFQALRWFPLPTEAADLRSEDPR